jgi:sugar O-acyltransferase (sialic acid O-acetyltransferase NeuD family)
MSRVVVFGTGSFAQCVRFYLDNDSPHEVVAHTVHADNIERDSLDGLPVVPFEEVEERHPAVDHAMYVAVGYRDVNRVRARICAEAKAKGYGLVSYISSRATFYPEASEIGENVFVFEDNTIQPFGRIGDDVVLWSGNHIGHHVEIGDHCFITSHVVVSGHVKVGANTFLGVNATIRDAIEIGEANVIGAGAVIMKSTQDKEVYITPRTKPDDRTSDHIGM